MRSYRLAQGYFDSPSRRSLWKRLRLTGPHTCLILSVLRMSSAVRTGSHRVCSKHAPRSARTHAVPSISFEGPPSSPPPCRAPVSSKDRLGRDRTSRNRQEHDFKAWRGWPPGLAHSLGVFFHVASRMLDYKATHQVTRTGARKGRGAWSSVQCFCSPLPLVQRCFAGQLLAHTSNLVNS